MKRMCSSKPVQQLNKPCQEVRRQDLHPSAGTMRRNSLRAHYLLHLRRFHKDQLAVPPPYHLIRLARGNHIMLR